VKVGHSDFGMRATSCRRVEPPLCVALPDFQYDDGAQRWSAVHHPFPSPQGRHADLLMVKKARRTAGAAVSRPTTGLNCIELGGGSVVSTARSASKVFPRAQDRRAEAQLKFLLLDALPYGRRRTAALRSAWAAFVMLMTGSNRCATVIAGFPETQRARICSPTHPARSARAAAQLHIRLLTHNRLWVDCPSGLSRIRDAVFASSFVWHRERRFWVESLSDPRVGFSSHPPAEPAVAADRARHLPGLGRA